MIVRSRNGQTGRADIAMKNAVLPVLVTLMGVAWQFGMTILDWMGPLFDAVGLGDAVIDMQVWLLNHPEAAADIVAWSLMIGGVAVPLALYGGPRVYRSWRRKDLEIVYDPADPDGQFGGVGPWVPYGAEDDAPAVTAFVLRIGVRNNGARPMLDVAGTLEGAIVKRPHPVALRFTQTRGTTLDLDPGALAFLDVAALPANPDAWTDNVSRIVVRIGARKTEEAVKVFFIDKKRMPPMYPANERNAGHAAQPAPAASLDRTAAPDAPAPPATPAGSRRAAKRKKGPR
ncbi:hypothetical protein [Shumkonia mesophila]|uniref:hypothetical protein n=1 Tax=Shumkonia mesophila TaxID=2838854 RepID=UPI0029343937|nr:hypothetical protein [Shumkonia mesophila]